MSLEINWSTKVISVPKSYTTLVQASPEIRELQINTFHQDLRDIEAADNGVVWLPTHNHVAPIDVGGVTLARVVEIINGYTVTFEDGQYAVNIQGGNSNIGDNVNVNQVSVRSFNSGGLVTSVGIESIEYDKGIWIDATSSYTGSLYPTGTLRQPVNNLADALVAAEFRGFKTLFLIGDFTFGATDNIDGYTVVGDDPTSFTVTVTSGCSTQGSVFNNCKLTGALDGDVVIRESMVYSLTGVEGVLFQTVLAGNVTLAGTDTVNFIECYSGVAGTGTPEVDMGGSGRDLAFRAYSGGIKITNCSAAQNVSVDFISGQLKIAADVTAGTFAVRGSGVITEDLSTGTTINKLGLTNPGLIWDEDITLHTTADTVGEALKLIRDETGGKWEMVGNQLIIYEDDNVTEVARFNLFDSSGTPAMKDVTKRERV